jgi:PIG-X / PBN1
LLHALFPADIVFYHLKQLTPETGALSISVPVADQSQLALVQNMTILGILMGFMYLFVKGVRVGIKGLRWRGKGKEKAKEL